MKNNQKNLQNLEVEKFRTFQIIETSKKSIKNYQNTPYLVPATNLKILFNF
jgi:hypothetical protein